MSFNIRDTENTAIESIITSNESAKEPGLIRTRKVTYKLRREDWAKTRTLSIWNHSSETQKQGAFAALRTGVIPRTYS